MNDTRDLQTLATVCFLVFLSQLAVENSVLVSNFYFSYFLDSKSYIREIELGEALLDSDQLTVSFREAASLMEISEFSMLMSISSHWFGENSPLIFSYSAMFFVGLFVRDCRNSLNLDWFWGMVVFIVYVLNLSVYPFLISVFKEGLTITLLGFIYFSMRRLVRSCDYGIQSILFHASVIAASFFLFSFFRYKLFLILMTSLLIFGLICFFLDQNIFRKKILPVIIICCVTCINGINEFALHLCRGSSSCDIYLQGFESDESIHVDLKRRVQLISDSVDAEAVRAEENINRDDSVYGGGNRILIESSVGKALPLSKIISIANLVFLVMVFLLCFSFCFAYLFKKTSHSNNMENLFPVIVFGLVSLVVFGFGLNYNTAGRYLFCFCFPVVIESMCWFIARFGNRA